LPGISFIAFKCRQINRITPTFHEESMVSGFQKVVNEKPPVDIRIRLEAFAFSET
jgi:hypothetical protein